MATATKTQVTRDAFGNVEGSNRALINSKITTTPQTAAEILRSAGVTVGFGHLQRLAAAGKITRTVDGKYMLVDGNKVKAKKKAKATA